MELRTSFDTRYIMYIGRESNGNMLKEIKFPSVTGNILTYVVFQYRSLSFMLVVYIEKTEFYEHKLNFIS